MISQYFFYIGWLRILFTEYFFISINRHWFNDSSTETQINLRDFKTRWRHNRRSVKASKKRTRNVTEFPRVSEYLQWQFSWFLFVSPYKKTNIDCVSDNTDYMSPPGTNILQSASRWAIFRPTGLIQSMLPSTPVNICI